MVVRLNELQMTSVFRRVATALCVLAGLQAMLAPAQAGQLLVLEVRGTSYKPGDALEDSQNLVLNVGERLTIIGADGNSQILRGPFNGPVLRAPGATSDAQNLQALVTNRKARTNTFGVVRAGVEDARLPEPWVLDVARSGQRCIRMDEAIVFWRESASKAEQISVFPPDRSWRVDLDWAIGQARLALPDEMLSAVGTALVVERAGAEVSLALAVAPQAVTNPQLITSWLMHAGCLQQADAALSQLVSGQAR